MFGVSEIVNKIRKIGRIGRNFRDIASRINVIESHLSSVTLAVKEIGEMVREIDRKRNSSQKTIEKLWAERKITQREISRQRQLLEVNEVELVNLKLKTTKCENLIITTYPKFGSMNVGDAMITQAFVKLKLSNEPNFTHVIVYREVPLEVLDLSHVKNIYLPGMSVSPGVYPGLYKLFKRLEDIDSFNVIPIACSFQSVGDGAMAYDVEYSDRDFQFFKKINASSGEILCRDEMITKLLNENGVSAKMFGDLVLFDEEMVGETMAIPETISKVAFSVHHNPKYDHQALQLLKQLVDYFEPSVQIYITLHSITNHATDKFVKSLKEVGSLEIVSLYGEADNLSFYDDMDLHIGYRLHGHITFLRQRKPSILVSEDVRSYGFIESPCLNVGIFRGFEFDSVITDVMNFLDDSIKGYFENYYPLFVRVDQLYADVVAPAIEKR